jgi:hypothetical protein
LFNTRLPGELKGSSDAARRAEAWRGVRNMPPSGDIPADNRNISAYFAQQFRSA